MKIVAFIPIKLNNERCPNKNIRPFDNGRSLISYVLETVKKVSCFDEVYVFCSSTEIVKYLPEGVIFLERSTSLDTSNTSINQVMNAFREVVEADIYAMIHATAPFISEDSINKGIDAVVDKGYDSAFPVTKNLDFLWIDGMPQNYDTQCIPRTQDLKPFFVETSGFYIYTKEVVDNYSTRIGKNPFLIEVNKIEAVDVNDTIDFDIANAISRIFDKEGS